MLDRTNISDRKAALVVNSVAISLGHNIAEMTTSRSSIQRARKKNREKIASQIKESFNAEGPVCVHWEGKMLPDMTDKYKKKIDRLHVIVSGSTGNKLLGVPKLDSGSGLNQASAVYSLLNDWNLVNDVAAFCFDTTASNSGLQFLINISIT